MTPTKPKRRFLRFSVRTLLVVLTIFCVWLGWKVDRARNQKAAVETLRGAGATIFYRYQEAGLASPPGPSWLRNVLGDEYFTTPVVAILEGQDFSDDDLAALTNLRSLEKVTLYDANISDAALSRISGLRQLKSLGVGMWDHDTRLTGAASVHIRYLKSLEFLQLQAVDLSHGGIEHLAGLHSLVHLGLYETKIGDNDLPHLYSLTNLRKLNLNGTKCTDSGVAALRSRLPNCKVLWKPAG